MSSTFYIHEPLLGLQPADWLRKHATPALTISEAKPEPWVSYLRDNKLPCVIVKNPGFNAVGVIMSDRDVHRWVIEVQRGRWVAFYMAPRDDLAMLLPSYVQTHIARQMNVVDRLRLSGVRAAAS